MALLGGQRRPAEAVRPRQVRGHALEDGAPDVAVAAQRGLRMGMDVDEPGTHDPSGGIDHGRGAGIGQLADGDDPVAAHADVRRDRGCAAAIDHRAAAQEQVEVHG